MFTVLQCSVGAAATTNIQGSLDGFLHSTRSQCSWSSRAHKRRSTKNNASQTIL